MPGAVSTMIQRLRARADYAFETYGNLNEAVELNEAADMLEHQLLMIQNHNFDKVAIQKMDETSLEIIAKETVNVRRIFLTEAGTKFTKIFYAEQSDTMIVPSRAEENQPAVEIVHCKDCKHWGAGVPGETESVKCCEYAKYMVGKNGYCVYGEVSNGKSN